MTTITTDTDIVKDVRSSWCKIEKRSIHAAYLNGEKIGTFDSREQAEAALDDEMYRLLEDGLIGAALDDEPAPADCCQAALFDLDSDPIAQELRHMRRKMVTPFATTSRYSFLAAYDGIPVASVTTNHAGDVVLDDYALDCGYIARSLVVEHAPESLVLACTRAPQPRGVPLTGNEVALTA